MIRGAAAVAVIAVALLLSWRDLMSDSGQRVAQASAHEENFANIKDSIPQPKMKSRMAGPTLKFMFW